MITFKLNGKPVQGQEGQYVLQVAEKHGVEIPTLCHHKALEPSGMCRICTVEMFDGRRSRFVTACNYPIREGLEINTDSEAVHAGRKLIVELLLARCPEVPLVQELAKAYGIEKPRFKTEDDTCILCGLCVRMCEKMGNSAIAFTGRGVDMKVDTPFHLQTDVCLACGACASVCPTGHITLDKIRDEITKQKNIKRIPSEYERGLKDRKPVYVPYAQAVPNTPVIDREVCVHFKTGGCRVCTEFCGVDAIDHTMEDEIVEVEVGAIILAPGFESFDPSKFDGYHYADHPNVITAMEMERLLSASGPTSGHLVRLSDHREPKKIAWFQCVGSRDLNRCNNSYCSSVCCMYAIKEAVIAKEHVGDDLDCAVFYMDIRSQGKDFDRYYDAARRAGVRFIRSRVHSIVPPSASADLSLRYVSEQGAIVEEVFDMVVLSTGLQIAPQVVDLADRLGIRLDADHFTQTDTFHPVATSVSGIYACGAFTGPKDIPQSVMEASAAACAATEKLAAARHSRTRSAAMPPERSLARQAPRIGVFVCNCGINIGGVVRVPEVAEDARTLTGVIYVEENLFTCSQDTQEKIAQAIEQHHLNRIVIAACSPRTHEGLFQETLTSAGLNKFLLEMANIRNQDAWVHANDPDAATAKAKDLVRMAVAKAALLHPLQQSELPIHHSALVVGGGVAGLIAALALARQGYPVHLVEKAQILGGHARNLYRTYKGESTADYVKALIQKVERHDGITLYLGAHITRVEGFVGNFQTLVSDGTCQNSIDHGVVILATGAKAYKPKEFLYGDHPAVVTHLEMDALLRNHDERLVNAQDVAFIQCVGSRNSEHPYCSKVCCTHTLTSAVALKEMDSRKNVYVLYRDIRAYGTRERLYQQARAKGVLFFPYTPANPPSAEAQGDRIALTFEDSILGCTVCVDTDLLCLATAIVSHGDQALARLFKVPTDQDGWLLEAHQKLRPVEFAVDGVFLCGMAHYPKPIEESIAQAQAAASRALTILARKAIRIGGQVARIDAHLCSGCMGCVDLCPYGAIGFNALQKKAEINAALCKGCGTCAAACPSEAVTLMGFSTQQIYAQIERGLVA